MTSLPQSKNAGAAKDGKKSGARSALPTESSGPAMGSGSRSGPICGPTRSTSRSLARLVWSWRNLCSRALSRRSCSGSRRRCHPRRTHSSCSRASSGSRQDLRLCRSHFPDWKFAAPDCVAAFGLHGALVVGPPVPVTDQNRDRLAALLPAFELTLRRGDAVIDTGIGANALDGPPAALAHLARVVAGQPQFTRLAAGEIVTTGTITDAWPVVSGETWSSNYGALGLDGLTLTFA